MRWPSPSPLKTAGRARGYPGRCPGPVSPAQAKPRVPARALKGASGLPKRDCGRSISFRDPGRVFGLFAIAAGMNVLGLRLADAGHPLATGILAGVAAAVWLGLTYGVPASLLARSRDSVLGDVNGTWLLWVVATQSLSLVASTLVRVWPSRSGLLAPFAVGLWSIGLVLYLLLVSLILQRWLTVPVTPQTLSPPYWILMGATAIIVLAGAHILALPAALAVVRATTPS